MAERPFVSVIIVNFNGKRFLDGCLGSLSGLDYPADRFEVVLVDNASSDGSVDYVADMFPWIRVVHLNENMGFSGGNNVGFREARGELVALLNNDTVVERDWLTELVMVMKSDPDIGIATSKILFKARPNIINNAGSMLLSNGWGSDRGFNEEDAGQYDRVEEVFCACGASMMLRRDMLDEIGQLDDIFFTYYEDTDLSWRARLMGWKVVYTYKSRMYHDHAGTSVEWSPRFTYYVLRNRLFMLVKDAPWGLFFRSFALFLKNTVYSFWLRAFRRGVTVNSFYSPKIRLRVLVSLLRYLPSLLVKRRRIRSAMKVSDEQIMGWVVKV